jgi:maltose alpha-D-glucosyltransferase/alpha-amylase
VSEPRWYKDAVIYEVHVRAFFDGNEDGIGDFPGLIQKLDYLQDLGVTAIWLLPFYPSPLRDDGYDIADYRSIHPDFGTIRDFKAFLREAHRRGLRVITELVLNHTSDQHPWFQRARRAEPGSSDRDFYVWSDSQERYHEARIIFQDFEASNWSWDAEAGAYYWHRFYAHQPDLNFDSPDVRRGVLEHLDFWLGMGVDGFRLDAVPYLFEREETNCENLPETHEFLRELRRHVDERFDDRLLLAEANQWPEDAAAYLGEGDECHMAFHFPLMPRLFMAMRMEDRFPIIDIIEQTPAVPESCQWALFLRNHDELTLEMVTDEERDYMYRVYAQDPQARLNLGIRRRLLPLLGGNRLLVELLNAVLFSLPGTPFIYYGDEIGMGDNIYLGDRNGVRTPMQWNADLNAGFSRANPQQLYLPVISDPEYHPGAVNVGAQQNNPNSLLWWTKRLIALRKRYRSFSHGSLEFLYPENRKVLAFVRVHEDERILVVANLSRHAQYVELDLSRFRGMHPVELFGGNEFPPIGDLPYLLTLGPHAFYWFAVEPQRVDEVQIERHPPVMALAGSVRAALAEKNRTALQEALPGYLRGARWFGGKGRRIKSAEIIDTIRVPHPSAQTQKTAGYLALVQVDYTEGDPETYVVPMAGAGGARAKELLASSPEAVVAGLEGDGSGRVLIDGLWDRGFARALLGGIAAGERFPGAAGEIRGTRTEARGLAPVASDSLEPHLIQGEQSNTSVLYGDRYVLKLYRRTEPGPNPDYEIGRFLTERAKLPHVPPVVGALEYLGTAGEPAILGVLQAFVPNEGDAWSYTVDAVQEFAERALARPRGEAPPAPAAPLLELAGEEPTELAGDLIGPYLETARVLGMRTAELHLALASDEEDPAFAPEPFSLHHQRSVYQALRGLTHRVFDVLRRSGTDVPGAAALLEIEQEVLNRFRRLADEKIATVRIRCHGDYHLGQLLWTGKDFVVIDFEGEPARPLGERRIKRSPFRDVAGMLRSFHYAAHVGALGENGHAAEVEGASRLEPWLRYWKSCASAAFVRSYLESAGEAPFVPRDRAHLQVLLNTFVLEKALYEVAYEVNHRPGWARIPLEGIVELVEAGV